PPSQAKLANAVASPSLSLNAQELVLAWFKAYPGLWISPLALGLLGGWVIAQPNLSSPSSAEVSPAGVTADLPGFVRREAVPLGPESPFGEAAANPAGLIADPPALDPASFPPVPSAADPKQASSTAASSAASPPAAAPALQPEAKAKVAEQIAAANRAAAQAKAPPADAKAILEERARNQAAAFAQAKANQAASSTPPQPAPPIQGNPAVDQMIIMQVAIAEGDSVLSMGGSNQSVIMTQAGEPLMQLAAGEYGMRCDGAGLVLNGQKLPATVMMAPYGGGLNYVRDRSYRGQIQFICQGSTVLAVNHIDMLNYLYSVVGSEVSPSWPAEALKAQSVAARSYALTYYFRPAKPHFHIGDTESYQVYKGTVSEDERVKQAVQATAGEFISYGGGIVESLYAASDDIVMEAFQGGGMSQLGALDFAKQGYNYLQILGYYYPQTSLGRLTPEGGS
ncbi:MAG: SpoIID/LytB domain-containing protein, partial [Synechococcales cyanobacterium RM1_1_8]|nr:SpoIID/LytB domain-containing protein [Synechococcales cyanobacterium RM1_1_8]